MNKCISEERESIEKDEKSERGSRKSSPKKTVYYKDESDDFSVPNIKTRRIDESYKYLTPSVPEKIIRFLLYRVIATPAAWLFCKITLGHRVENKKVLKKAKGSPIFIYANHTQQTADAYIPSIAAFPKSAYTIAHPDNVSIPVIGGITPYLGAIPIPTTVRAMRNFMTAIEKRLLENAAVTVYPEAHIWPFYTGIRQFPDTSFLYPVRYNTPCYTMTTAYKERAFFKKPRAVTYVDGPFYPDLSIPERERPKKLHDEIYQKMLERSRESTVEYIRYVRM